jgi:hypothetical protein
MKLTRSDWKPFNVFEVGNRADDSNKCEDHGEAKKDLNRHVQLTFQDSVKDDFQTRKTRAGHKK